MSAEAITLLVSFSALAFACFFVGRLIKAALQIALVLGFVFVAWKFAPQVKQIGCDMSAKLATPVQLCQ